MRTDANNKNAMNLLKLLPKNVNNFTVKNAKKLSLTYFESCGFSTPEDMAERLMNEISTYKGIFENDDITFLIENTKEHQTINDLLIIAAIFPSTNAEVERLFSALRRVKDYLRNTISQERLNGVLLAHSNRHIKIDEKIIFNNFVNKATRRSSQILFD